MSASPRDWAQKKREYIWAECVAPVERPSIQAWASPKQLVEDMDASGIEKAILQGWYWENPDTCSEHNKFYAQLIREFPDRLCACATIQPLAKSQALDEIARAQDHGFVGIGEIHAQAQGFSLLDDCWTEVLSEIANWSVPTTFHVTDPDTPTHPGKMETPLEDFLKLAREWPKQNFILAHLGARIPLRDLFEIELDNLYYDCAAIPLLYEAKVISEIADSIGIEKILFGSDYPLRVTPKTQKEADFQPSIDYLIKSGLSEENLASVFNSNCRRLYNLD